MVRRLVEDQETGGLGPPSTQASPVRSNCPPLKVETICSAASARNMNRASVARQAFFGSDALSRLLLIILHVRELDRLVTIDLVLKIERVRRHKHGRIV